MLDIPEKWIIDSLNILKEKNDATMAGGFTGAVMNLLGRYLVHPKEISLNKKTGKTFVNNKFCFCEFIDKYMQKYDQRYSKYKDLLWHFMRCEGVHSVLARDAVVFGGGVGGDAMHLNIESIVETGGRALFIFLPKFIDDLKLAVEKFYSDLNSDKLLREKQQQVLELMYQEGQKYINNNFPTNSQHS